MGRAHIENRKTILLDPNPYYGNFLKFLQNFSQI